MMAFVLIVVITVLGGDNEGFQGVSKQPFRTMNECQMAEAGIRSMAAAFQGSGYHFSVDMVCEIERTV